MENHRSASASIPVAAGAAGISAALRLIAIPLQTWNFAPVGTFSLYAGARLPWYAAFALPLGTMYITDSILWRMNSGAPFDPFVYASYAVIVLIGMLLKKTESPWKIGLATLAASTLFFLVTNFGAWLNMRGPGKTYPDSMAGLLTSYIAGLPFARPTVIGDLLFAPVFFGAHALLQRRAATADSGIKV